VYARVLDIDPEYAEARERMTSLQDRPIDPTGEFVSFDTEPGSRNADSSEFDALLTDFRSPVQNEVGFEGDTQAHFELGVAFKQMEMWDEAVAELEQAVEGRDDPRPVLEALAECHARSGSADKALSVLLDAEEHPANRASPSPSIAYRIARLNEQAGDHSKAVEWLLQVVAIDPDYRDAASRLSTLSG
jgi:tetratricopeptide (TPR) repeat protein